MINYSIALRAVNTNLLEINQAKSRIAKAKEAGLAPDPADVTLANTELQTKAYAVAQYSDVMTIEKFAKHISEHGCVYSRADKFNSGFHITSINVVWECGQEFKNLIADAEFNLVASRAAQATGLKAVKAGETGVDLSKPDGTDPNGSGGGSGSNGSNSSNGSNGQTPSPNGQYTIQVTSANIAQSTVTGGGTFTSGSRIQIVATPKSGYAFDKWSDGVTTASRQITVSQDLNLTASFKEASAGGGTDQTAGSGDDDNQSSVPEF